MRKTVLYGTIALSIVFIIDLFTPLGVAVGVLYLLCFVIVFRQRKFIIILFAIVTCLLTLVKLILFTSDSTSYMVFLNRGISIVAIVIVALIALRHRALIERYNSERNCYISELENMITLTSHSVRKPIASCLGIMGLVENKRRKLTQEEFLTSLEHLKKNALELDELTKELTLFIDNSKKKKTKFSDETLTP